MKTKPIQLPIKSGAALQCLLFMLILAVPALQYYFERSNAMDIELRGLRVERIRLAQALDVLTEHNDLIKTINESPVSKDELTLSLIETIKQTVEKYEFELVKLSVVQTGSSSPQALSSLRINLSAQVSAAADLLSLFDAVQAAADWRPIEVRACNLVRGEYSGAHRLQANCTIDVYRFMEQE